MEQFTQMANRIIDVAILEKSIKRADDSSSRFSSSRFLLGSSRYPSMPRYPPSPPKTNVDASEVKCITIVVKGMECAACAASIEKAVKRLPGIKEAAVAVLQEKAQVVYHPAFIDETAICEAILDCGFQATVVEDIVNDNISVCRLRIKGMTCTSCSGSIESALQNVHGIKRARIALATEQAEVHYDPRLITVGISGSARISELHPNSCYDDHPYLEIAVASPPT